MARFAWFESGTGRQLSNADTAVEMVRFEDAMPEDAVLRSVCLPHEFADCALCEPGVDAQAVEFAGSAASFVPPLVPPVQPPAAGRALSGMGWERPATTQQGAK